MAVSVRLDPLLEKNLELSAKRQGLTKTQFIVAALERALGHKDPYQLLLQVKGEAALQPQTAQWQEAYGGEGDVRYDTEQSRQTMIAKLRAKHGLSVD
jgi:RHH-type rel operon transcriptional repressor/antitoxin RelB